MSAAEAPSALSGGGAADGSGIDEFAGASPPLRMAKSMCLPKVRNDVAHKDLVS